MYQLKNKYGTIHSTRKTREECALEFERVYPQAYFTIENGDPKETLCFANRDSSFDKINSLATICYVDHDAALLAFLDIWPGTPEELGETIYDATKIVTPPDWSDADKERWTRERECKAAAIRRISDLPGGQELLKMEIEAHKP